MTAITNEHVNPRPDSAPTTGHVERSIPGTESWRRLHADHLARYFFATGFVSGGRVLDCGTGPGYGAALISASGAASVDAVDIDPETIARATSEYSTPGLRFLVDDCEILSNVQGPYDLICSFENIEHLRRPERFVENAARLLADDGVLLCSSPDRRATYADWVDEKPFNPFHHNEWYAGEFYELLANSFEVVEVRSQVESLSHSLRKSAIDNLQQHLIYLWSNPALRFLRAFGKLMNTSKKWPPVEDLAVPSPADYPIVPGVIADAVGEPWCLVAVCRRPRR